MKTKWTTSDERRTTVRITALRLIQALPAAEQLPLLLDTVDHDRDVRVLREAATMIGRHASERRMGIDVASERARARALREKQ